MLFDVHEPRLRARVRRSDAGRELAKRGREALGAIRDAREQVVKYLHVAPTSDGKKRAMLVIKGCTTDGQVLTY